MFILKHFITVVCIFFLIVNTYSCQILFLNSKIGILKTHDIPYGAFQEIFHERTHSVHSIALNPGRIIRQRDQHHFIKKLRFFLKSYNIFSKPHTKYS